MATNLSRPWLYPSESLCLDPSSKLLCWERCVKRKYNDGSGQLLQGYNMAPTEGGNESFLCDTMWSTMPNIAHHHKTFLTSRTRHHISSLQDQQCRGCNLPLASVDHPLQRLHVHTDKEDVSKKRMNIAMSVEALCGAVQACDMAAEHEVLRLKEALKFQKLALRKLYRDLEEERCASATAANEAMAMIRRLQEEKAAALTESRHFERASEERTAYNQEAIALLKDALSSKEHESFYLQNHIEDYRNILRKMKSGQGVTQMIDGSCLEGNKENAQLLLKETAACFFVEPKNIEGDLDADCDTGNRAPGDSMYWPYYPSKESILEGQMGLANQNHRSGSEIEKQDCENASMSILARVARLEERFTRLGQKEALDPDSLDLVPCNTQEDASSFGCGGKDPAPMHNIEMDCLGSAKLNNGLVVDNLKDLDNLKYPVFEKVATNSEHEKQELSCSATFEERRSDPLPSQNHLLALHKVSDNQECSHSEMADTASEGKPGVYEIQCRADGSAISDLDYIDRSHKSGFGGRDFLLIDSIKVLEDNVVNGATSIYGRHLAFCDGLADCDTSMSDKLVAEISSGGREDFKSSVGAKGLENLKLRLQALEGERTFMKEAIEALRKENLELKLIQEIAYQLQELKGSGRTDQLPSLSFFKKILSFAGLQSLACSQKRRVFNGYQRSLQTSSADKPNHGGLLHLLNTSLSEEKSVCVTRERKVKLGKG